MINNDWEKFGDELRRTIQDAVDSRDFSRRIQESLRNRDKRSVWLTDPAFRKRRPADRRGRDDPAYAERN